MIQKGLAWFRRRRFLVLLVSLLGLSVFQPILEDLGLVGAKFFLKIFLTIVLFSAIYAVSQSKRVFVTAVILGIPSFMAYWIQDFLDFPLVGELTILCLMSLFFVLVACAILSHVLKHGPVTGEKISAAICAYLFIGILWAYLYFLLHSFFPGAFNIESPQMSDFMYYSFITLSTLGYGDITPVIASAQALAFVEAITGQIYLAVLIAGLVGMHIASSKKNEDGDKSGLDG